MIGGTADQTDRGSPASPVLDWESRSWGRIPRKIPDGAAAKGWSTDAGLRIAPDNGRMEKITAFVEESIRTADRKIEISLGQVKNVERIKAETGFDLAGFDRILDNYGVRHTIKRHGNAKAEQKRGQIAVTLGDFSLIPFIVAEPDAVFSDGKNKIGRDVIVFVKLIDGIGYRHVEEIRKSGKIVATDSLRKKAGLWRK